MLKVSNNPSKWVYHGTYVESVPEEFFAFVYRITNIDTGRAYIGKKLLWFKGHKMVNKKKKKILKESDWRTYNGSSTELQADVTKFGEECFRYEILRYCKTKGECSYWEAKIQFEEDVLYHPELYYNSYIGCRIHRSHLKLGKTT
jgi:hypothetical protein